MNAKLQKYWAATLWSMVVLAITVLFYFQNQRGIHLESDLLRLLPQENKNSTLETARDVFMREVAQRVFLLVGAPTFSEAKNAAEFYQQQMLESADFSSLFLRNAGSGAEQYTTFYFPAREQLLSSSFLAQLQNEDGPQNLVHRVEKILYTPMSGMAAQALDEDPLLLFSDFLATLPKPPGKLTLREGYLTTSRDKSEFIFLYGILKANVFSRSAQQKAAATLERIDQQIAQKYPSVQLIHAGALQFAKVMANAAEKDLSVIGVGSFAGTALLVFFTFFSLPPLLFSMFTVTVGVLCATSLSLLLFPSVHVLTLGFGASLIGVCADYAFHYFCHRFTSSDADSRSVLRAILPGISIGVLTSVLGYLGLFLTPFPGLNQMAFFAIIGMITSYLCVVCWVPLLPTAAKKKRAPLLLSVSQAWLAACQRKSVHVKLRRFGIFVCPFIIWGLWRLQIDDDVRTLQRPPVALVKQEQEFRDIIGGLESSRFYLLSAPDSQQLLEREELLASKLVELKNAGELVDFQSVSSFVPSASRQKHSFEQLKAAVLDYQQEYTTLLAQLGLKTALIERYFSRLSNLQFSPISIEAWLKSPISEPMRFLWLGVQGDAACSIVSLAGSKNLDTLRKIAAAVPGSALIDSVSEISEILGKYRFDAAIFIGIFYLFIYLFLIWRYGFSSGTWGMVPACASALLILSTQGLLGEPITLFNVLAIVIVLGLAIDYSVFLLEGMNSQGPTMMAIVLSTLSTILSFGLLAMSSTAVLRSFGISLFVGVTVAMFLAPLVIPKELNEDA